MKTAAFAQFIELDHSRLERMDDIVKYVEAPKRIPGLLRIFELLQWYMQNMLDKNGN